jgi:hypothetical protein
MSISAADLAPLDHGTRGRITLIMAVLREHKVENDRLKRLVRDHVPALGGPNTAPVNALLPAESQRKIKLWLTFLTDGSAGLEVNGSGVQITRRSRPGQVIVTPEVLQALQEICSVIGPKSEA